MAKFCQNCGAEIEEIAGTKFCPSCGAPVEIAPAAPAQPEKPKEPQPQPAPQPQPQPAPQPAPQPQPQPQAQPQPQPAPQPQPQAQPQPQPRPMPANQGAWQPQQRPPVQQPYGQPMQQRPPMPQQQRPAQPPFGQPMQQRPAQQPYGQPMQQRPTQQPYGQPMQQRPVQQPYGQPANFQQNYAMPPKKKGKGLIIAIIAILLLAIIAGVVCFFIFGNKDGENADTKNSGKPDTGFTGTDTNTGSNTDVQSVVFTDVSENDWYYEPVLWASQKSIVSGDTFYPDDWCERAQALTFLWRAKGKPSPNLKVSPFTDVKEGDYFYEPVLWAFENGLISVSDDGQFHPTDATTRAQAVTFLYRAEGSPAQSGIASFGDVGSEDWFAPAVIWAENRGLISPDAYFNPEDACVRAVYVTFLYRCYK